MCVHRSERHCYLSNTNYTVRLSVFSVQGAVWTMKRSHCSRLLASGGQDNLLRVWVLRDAFPYFDDMRQKYNEGTMNVCRPRSHLQLLVFGLFKRLYNAIFKRKSLLTSELLDASDIRSVSLLYSERPGDMLRRRSEAHKHRSLLRFPWKIAV